MLKVTTPVGIILLLLPSNAFGFQQSDKAKNTKAKIAHATVRGESASPRFGG